MKKIAFAALLSAACGGGPIAGEARTVAMNRDGLHLDINSTPGIDVDIGGRMTQLPTGKGRVVVPLTLLEGSTVTLPISRPKLVFLRDRGTIRATIPYDAKLVATLPSPEEPNWVRWLAAQGGTTSKLGIVRDGDRKLPVRLDDEGDCKVDLASSKGLVLKLGDEELKADPTFGGAKTTCAKLLDRATFDWKVDGDREWLDLPLAAPDGKIVSHFLLDRDTAEEFLQKRINRMLAQKAAFGAPVADATRSVYRDSEKKFHFSGAAGPIRSLAVASIKGEREAPDCAKVPIENKGDANIPPKTIKHLFVDLDVAVYDRAGKELARKTFEGGATGCPKSITPKQAGQTLRDGPDRAAIDTFVNGITSNLK